MDYSRTLTLSEVVAGHLRQALHDSAYVCGDRLVELTIANEMNVSQNTVRDALRILEGEGWLVKRPRYGVYVRSFKHSELDELYALRAALETLALGWACDSASYEALTALKTHIEATRSQVEMGNSYGAREALLHFHSDVVRLANKPQTTRILMRLFNQSRLLENLRELHMPRTVRQWRETVTAYETLYVTLSERDCVSAQKQMQDIIEADGKALIPVLELTENI